MLAKLKTVQTPRDCVVVYRMPDFPPGEKWIVPVVTQNALHNVQSGEWYRTPPASYTEASKRAAHYSVKSEAFVVPATRYVLERWLELPITPEMTDYLYRRRAPRVSLIDLVRRRWNPN